jgi:hypothetical protein
MKHGLRVWLALGLLLAGWRVTVGAQAPDTPEAVIRALYQRVSFEAGSKVDWAPVKALFIPEAVIVLRTSRTAMSVFSLDAFIQDFQNFIKDAKLEDRAFTETVVALTVQQIGDVARASVHYQVSMPSDKRPPQDGVDVFLLMKRDGAWKIVSLVNEVVRPGVPVPDDLKKSSAPAR